MLRRNADDDGAADFSIGQLFRIRRRNESLLFSDNFANLKERGIEAIDFEFHLTIADDLSLRERGLLHVWLRLLRLLRRLALLGIGDARGIAGDLKSNLLLFSKIELGRNRFPRLVPGRLLSRLGGRRSRLF